MQTMRVKGALWILVVLIAFVGTSSSVSATPVEWKSITGIYPLSQLLNGGSLQVGDKIFSDFEVFNIPLNDPCFPIVTLQGGINEATGDYGLLFGMNFNVGAGKTYNSTIDFKVTIDEAKAPSIYFIKDVTMILKDPTAVATGTVNASEVVYQAPTGQLLASLSTAKNPGDNDADIEDHAEFNPVKSIWVHKDISVTGGIDGNASLPAFYQFYSQVPEPASMTLLLTSIGLLMNRRRAKKQ